MNMHQVQAACLEYLEKNLESYPAHDISHVRRVVNNTLYLTDIDEAVRFLAGIGYPEQLLGEIHHAIEAHSFSAAVRPRSLEARIVQDADRLEALGAIGIARCLLTGGNMGTPLYDPDDPFCDARDPDDRKYTLDHFYTKLFKLPGTMQTRAGRAEANRRVDYMRDFLAELAGEIANSRFNPRN
jgi:uncharacterized protein